MNERNDTRSQSLLGRRQAPDWVILALACVAQFMVILDVSVVNVALPSIGRELHYSPVGLQWVVNAYVLTFAGFLLLGGRAADAFGRRRIFLIGLFVFAGTSLVGGFAQSAGWLTAARAIQGIGGAALSPTTLTIIITTFSGPRLARALGLWSAVGGAGGAIGVLLGGVLTSELSWRWVLFINVPIGVVTGFAAIVFLGEARGTGPRQGLDIPGAVTVTAGLASLVYAIVGTSQYAWGSAHTLGWLGAAAVLLVAFFVLQVRGTAPLMPLRLFRIRGVSGANTVIFLVGAVFFSMWYFLSLYLQDVLHFGALRSGFAFLPMGIAIIIGAQVTARIMPRTGIRPLLLAGTLLATAGFFWLSRIGPGSHYWGSVFGPGVMISFALGILFTPLASAGTMGVDRKEAGLASGLLNTSRQVGGSLGLAILATLATSHTHALERTGLATGSALADGFGRAFLVGGVIGLAAMVASFVVPAGSGRAAPASTGAAPADAVPAVPATSDPVHAGAGAVADGASSTSTDIASGVAADL